MKWKYQLALVSLDKGEPRGTPQGTVWDGLQSTRKVLDEYGSWGWEIIGLFPESNDNNAIALLMKRPIEEGCS
jgi:hypothetical protein